MATPRERLDEYCAKHKLTLLETYTTLGETRDNIRAKVKTESGEIQYLYYDPSNRRRFKSDKKMLEYQREGKWFEAFRKRGWRNVTLDNRKSVERRNQRHEENVMTFED